MISLGLSKQSSSSQQTQKSDSSGLSLTDNNSSSVSGASSSGSSSGISGSSGVTSSNQGVFASDMLQQLYGGALGAAGALDPSVAASRVNQLFTGGSGILDQLSSGGAGADYLKGRLTGDNSQVLNAQIDSLGSDLGRFYKEQLNPVITGNSVAAGQLGGGRQGVAQGIASNSVLQQFATQAAGLRAADVTNRDNAALGLINAQNTGGATALGALPSLATLGSGASVLAPYQALSSVFGAPTTLTSAQGQTSSFGQESSQQQSDQYATAIAQELGISVDEAHSLMTGSSKGSGFGVNAGFGSTSGKG
jgi:hypothetical protein